MEFTALVLFLIFYFVHPQDWVEAIAGLNVIKPIMFLGIVGLLQRPNRTPVWGWMRTPHEWIMVAYLLHGIWVDFDWWFTLTAMLPLAAFYFLTSQTLVTEDRLDRFFKWWAACVGFICILGTATIMGMDITGAREIIDGQLGRLCLNSYMLDNPNALGHTAVTAFPLIYFTMVFRRDVGSRLLAIPMFILVTQCVVATESKGAYIAGAVAIAAALIVGRSFIVQISIAALLFIAGSFAITMLPRMADPEAMRHDEGVMGRALAFEQARTAYDGPTPAGWNRFSASILWDGEIVDKSTHSSIVQVGADQGPVGLFLYLSIFACAARSLFTLKTGSDILERTRLLLFALLAGFFASGWMINRSYHTEFFLMAGAATAFHKLSQERLRREVLARDLGVEVEDLPEEETPDEEAFEEEMDAKEAVPVLSVTPAGPDGGVKTELRADAGSGILRLWRRYGPIDFALGYALLAFSTWLWTYLINYFIPPT